MPKTKRKRDDHEPPADDGLSFTIIAPALQRKGAKKSKKDIFTDIDNPLDPSLDIEYSIEPGAEWETMKVYAKMKFIDVEFKKGDFVYVNRSWPPPDPLPDDASPEELLSWRKQNMWVARIAQVKANAASKVFVRLFWLYWPEELPASPGHKAGRLPHHGAREVVLSNHSDIIDATSISSMAELTHWDEDDDESDPQKDAELFYRSTLNFAKGGARSEVRKHCKCNEPFNPDGKPMYRCNVVTCSTWNHEDCLLDSITETLVEKASNNHDRLKSYLDQRVAYEKQKAQKHGRSLGESTRLVGERVLSAVESIIHTPSRSANRSAMHRIEEGDDAEASNPADDFDAVTALTPSAKARAQANSASKVVRDPPLSPPRSIGREAPTTPPLDPPRHSDRYANARSLSVAPIPKGKLQIGIIQDSDENGKGKDVWAWVTLRAENGEEVLGSWEFVLNCLKCGQRLD